MCEFAKLQILDIPHAFASLEVDPNYQVVDLHLRSAIHCALILLHGVKKLIWQLETVIQQKYQGFLYRYHGLTSCEQIQSHAIRVNLLHYLHENLLNYLALLQPSMKLVSHPQWIHI